MLYHKSIERLKKFAGPTSEWVQERHSLVKRVPGFTLYTSDINKKLRDNNRALGISNPQIDHLLTEPEWVIGIYDETKGKFLGISDGNDTFYDLEEARQAVEAEFKALQQGNQDEPEDPNA